MSRPFENVGVAKVGKSMFNLSYEKKFTCDMGQLIPVMVDEVVPGDVFSIGAEVVVRFQPLVAPILHEINCYVHYFFVPNRILWDDWESFITGGADGTEAPTLPTYSPGSAAGLTKGTLWDYFGCPPLVLASGVFPVAFPWRGYNKIYNEYYRDQTLQAEVSESNNVTLNRAWEKDYFSSALPWQQRGTAPALPISGTTSAVWGTAIASNATAMQYNSAADVPFSGGNEAFMNNNTVDLSVASTFDIADLRLAFQIQRWLERNARAGVRYTEFLKAHFNVAPRDERLDRPEYIGGFRTPVIISEVLQTGETATTPQGNLAGHGISVDKKNIGKYRVKEFGIIMGIMSVMPRSVYQQGISRQWLKTTKYDYYFPEFANLSEQAILNGELFTTDANAALNTTIFGYQGRYDEMRVKQNMICGEMRDTFDYWHLGRQFGSVPTLNSDFIECDMTAVNEKRIFADTTTPGLIVNFANIIKAVRPLPIINNPGLIDHV